MGKSGIMHPRKMVERCEVEYKVDGEVIPMVSSYKYLGCVVDQHLEFKEMVEEKAVGGRMTLGAWLSRWGEEVGNIEIGTFNFCLNLLPSPLNGVLKCRLFRKTRLTTLFPSDHRYTLLDAKVYTKRYL